MRYADINTGQRSAIVKFWNETQDADGVARRLCLPVEAVKAFLKTRPGYPGKLTTGYKTLRPKGAAKRDESAIFGRHGPEPKVTLPRLKFMDDTDGR
jgi:hypothetical protein